MQKLKFTVIIEKDEAGTYVATVPALVGCHTQTKDLNELDDRIREVIKLCLEKPNYEIASHNFFIGVHVVEVAI